MLVNKILKPNNFVIILLLLPWSFKSEQTISNHLSTCFYNFYTCLQSTSMYITYVFHLHDILYLYIYSVLFLIILYIYIIIFQSNHKKTSENSKK